MFETILVFRLRYIKASILNFSTIVEDLRDPVDIAVTVRENVENLREINATATYVTSFWVWECHNTQTFVPVDDYSI